MTKMVNLILKECMKKGFLLDKEVLKLFNKLEMDKAQKIVDVIANLKLNERVITEKIFYKNINSIKKAIGNVGDDIFYENKKKDIKEVKKNEGVISVLNNLSSNPRIYGVNDFISDFRQKYNKIKDILLEKDYDDITSIRKIGKNSNFTVIGSVFSKKYTKNKNLLLNIEDITGNINIIVNKNNKYIFEIGEKLILDDVVVFRGSNSGDLFFCNDIIFSKLKVNDIRLEDDCWVAFISDLHCGSINFMENKFLKFIKWINGKDNQIYNQISKNVKYLFVGGDLVEGVGHYLGQESDLNIKNMSGQYKKVQELFKLFRDDLKIVISPGSRDAIWFGEPQNKISAKYLPELYDKENINFVNNPSMITIEGKIKILSYHGANLYNLINENDFIKNKYGFSSPNNMLKELLDKRQLSPGYGKVDIIPDDNSSLIIDEVPNVVFSGSLHRCEVGMKDNIVLINGSCWVKNTKFLDKKGIIPDSCKVPLLNLKTREIKILDFSDDSVRFE